MLLLGVFCWEEVSFTVKSRLLSVLSSRDIYLKAKLAPRSSHEERGASLWLMEIVSYFLRVKVIV